MHNLSRSFVTSLTLPALLFAAACSGEKSDQLAGSSSQTESPATAGSASATATGDTVVVEMYSDGIGNYFKPAKIEAERGDVIRFVLKSGVHNVNFHPDSNSIKSGLPPASELLQIPEQTHDMVVTQSEGKYRFQCDPHAALGMKGELEVEKD